MIKKTIILIIVLILFICFCYQQNTLKEGDIIFQDLNTSVISDAIEEVTSDTGVADKEIDKRVYSHCGIVVLVGNKKIPLVIEAYGETVKLTPIEEFYRRSGEEWNIKKSDRYSASNSSIIVKRLRLRYRRMIPDAVVFALSQCGVPYDDEYLLDNGKMYCSELITDAFSRKVFTYEPMSFKNPQTGRISQAWIDHYKALGMAVPEGELGNNPNAISKSKVFLDRIIVPRGRALQRVNNEIVNYNVHTFYYSWYENEVNDGCYAHWNHHILPHWADTTWDNAGNFRGGDDIGADFYPELGCYSCNDTSIIAKHCGMIKTAGIGTIAMSWSGICKNGDKSMFHYLDIAQRYGLKVLMHIEPDYSDVQEFRNNINYIIEKYGSHKAFYRYRGKPFFYVYDSYKIPADQWKRLLTIEGDLTVRNTELDGYYIGLWVEENEHDFFKETGFDGFYTYFASRGFVYGSTPDHWPTMMDFAKENDLIFVPCVGPGYSDERIRPWNSQNMRERRSGRYYEEMFREAEEVKPEIIGITSFNEWHEGTQIEPAIANQTDEYVYKDYEGLDSWFYITKTKNLINEWTNRR